MSFRTPKLKLQGGSSGMGRANCPNGFIKYENTFDKASPARGLRRRKEKLDMFQHPPPTRATPHQCSTI